MRARGEDGFTLVELLVSVTVMLIIGGAVTTSLVVGLRTTGTTGDRLAQSSDANLLASYLVPDVQSANAVSTADSACGGGTAVVRFTWVDWTDLVNGTSTTHRASYSYVPPPGGTTTGSLIRSHCTGTSNAPVDRQTVARYLAPVAPVAECRSAAAVVVACSASPIPRTIKLTLTDRLPDISDYVYTVSASRRDS